MSILYKKARNVRFVSFRKNSNASLQNLCFDKELGTVNRMTFNDILSLIRQFNKWKDEIAVLIQTKVILAIFLITHDLQWKKIEFLSSTSDPCPTYYTLLGESCYIINQNQTWSRDDAQAHCDSREGHLVDLETGEEVTTVENWINNGKSISEQFSI